MSSGFILSSITYAQTSTQSISTSAPTTTENTSTLSISNLQPQKETPRPFKVNIAAERSSNLVAEGKDGDDTATTFMLMPTYKWSESLSSFARAQLEVSEVGERKQTLTDTQINLTVKGHQLSEKWKTSYSLNGFVPTNLDNKKETTFQGAGSIGVSLSGTYTFAEISYAPSYRRNVHEFNIAASGSENIKETLAHGLTVNVPLSSKFSLSFLGIYRTSWTYKGILKTAFANAADIEFSPLKDLTFNVGTSTEGSALKANGKDSNIEFFNENQSVLRAGVSYVL